jgi:starch synthase
VLKTINEVSNGNIFIKNGIITPFENSGPLAISTGRISKQKGFDMIFEAIPSVIEAIPNAKFLLLILPTEYSLTEIKEYAEYVKKFSNNLRIVFGVAPSIFNLAHISADIYLALSKWEPFGIIVLEAMASKLPVIATKVGGMQETLIDLKKDPERGTGVFIKEDSVSQLSTNIISLFKSARISETITLTHEKRLKIIDGIPDEKIKALIKENPQYFSKVRENCYTRVVKHFRWEKVSKKLRDLYYRLIELNKIRLDKDI